MAPMRVLISVPTFETICPETFKGIWDMDKGGNEVDFSYTRGYDCARARNDIVRKALKGGYDAVLMVDSDIIVPEDALTLLLGQDSGVSTGWYPMSGVESVTSVRKSGSHSFKDPFTVDEMEAMAASDEPVAAVKGNGMGCALIWTWVFEEMKRPWFAWTEHRSGSELSEDYYFCLKCSEAGIRVMVDSRVRCKHGMRKFY